MEVQHKTLADRMHYVQYMHHQPACNEPFPQRWDSVEDENC
jgi:hypothetical protein